MSVIELKASCLGRTNFKSEITSIEKKYN